MPRIGLLLIALFVLTTVGCDDDPASTTSSSPRAGTLEEPRRPTPQVVVTGTGDGEPAGCRPRAAALLVLDYLRALNEGSPRAVEFFDFEAGPAPGWYSVTSGDGAPAAASVSANDRDALGSYLAERHQRGELLQLIELRVAERGGFGHIEYRMTRQADDLSSRKPVEGKGAIHCASSKFVAWSMSVVGPGEATGRLCPAPEDGDRPDAIACVRA